MSRPPVNSPFDALASGGPEDVASLREEMARLRADIKSALDSGVPVSEFAFCKGLLGAAEAALAIVEAARP
jgi:hypothetical protein